MPFTLTFKANGAADPQSLPLLQDEATEAAYAFDGLSFLARYGTQRPDGTLDPLGEFAVDHEVVTDDGTTWNKLTFDPDPDDLLALDGGTYAVDLLTVTAEGVEDNFDDGTMTIRRGVSR